MLLVQVERGSIQEMLGNMTALFADSTDMEAVMQSGDIQQVGAEVLRISSQINQLSTLLIACESHTYMSIHSKRSRKQGYMCNLNKLVS